MSKNTKATAIDQLPKAQSRVEHYLDYLCGRATDIYALPRPQSRVEEFLEYLCHNGGIGGGGGANPNPFVNAQLNGDILTLVRDDGVTQEIDLSQLNFVKEWQDLEYATQSNHFNIFNPSTFEDGKFYNSIGYPEYGNDWGNFKITCNAGDTFTLFKKGHDSINLALFDGNRWVQNLKVSRNNDNGWLKYAINIPQGIQVDSISIPVHKPANNYKNEVMIFRGNVNAPNKYIPFTNNRVVSIDGENVAITFDSSNTALTSSTTVDAIKEIDGKVVTINNNITDLQTTLDGKVNITELSTTSQANKVPQLKDDGKLDLSMLPDMSINSSHVVDNNDQALELITNGTAGIGDIFIVKNPKNNVYMYVNENGVAFDEKCVELTMADGTVKCVNGVYANDLGEVEIGINNIEHLIEILEYFENDKSSLNKDNIFIGHNTFNELTLIGKNPFIGTITGEATTTGHNTGIYCGHRGISTGATSKYVSAIKIKVLNSCVVGETVDNIHVVEIRKSNNKLDDVVGEIITDGASYIVEEDGVYGKCIYVPVQKTYTDDTYFLVGKKGNRALSECRYTYQSDIAQCINNLNIDNLPAKDSALGHDYGNGWIVIHSLVTDNINVREELGRCVKTWTDLDNVELNAGDKVEIDGNEVSIKFDKGQTSLVSENVVSAIKELSNKVDNAGVGNIGTVTSVNNQQPNNLGAVTINATHINATLSGSTKTVETHLQEIGNGAKSLDTRISNLQAKKPQVHVGEIISTFKNHGNSYTLNGATYLYCGTNHVVSSTAYPELTNALGLSNVNNYSLPIINDISIRYDNAARTAVRKHYICAKIS